MKKSKKFNIIKIFTILIILTSCINNYNTRTLLNIENYKYEITYPKDWYFIIGSTDATRILLKDGNYIDSIAVLTKQPIQNNKEIDVDGTIAIYLFDKNNNLYKNWIKNLKNTKYSFVYILKDFSNYKNKKLSIPYNIVNKWYNYNKEYSFDVIVDIGSNKVIIFDFYTDDGGEKLEKQFYKIINSLERVKIN